MQPTTPTDGAHWLDVLPLLPLDRGVPVVQRIGQGIATGIAIRADVIRWDCWDGRRHGSVGRAHVDLDDPQGFAWALRYRKQQGPMTGSVAIQNRYDVGATTDADRLALARALAEVTP